MVLSATINQYAYASLRPRRDSRLTLASLDYDIVARYDHPRRMRFDGNLDLIKAAVKAMRVRRGADLWVHSDAPPGSGLGSSSALELNRSDAQTAGRCSGSSRSRRNAWASRSLSATVFRSRPTTSPISSCVSPPS